MECEYSEVVDAGAATFRCRRYAPRPVAVSDETLGERHIWPVVLAEDWCGEFLERQPDDDEERDPLSGFTRGNPEG